jgi:branched-chain amino acid aminotransferase
LELQPPKETLLYVILSTVGPYYPTGFEPVSLYCDENNIRAWPGGSGAKKVGGNYGPTIKTAKAATAMGYNQVLWLFED